MEQYLNSNYNMMKSSMIGLRERLKTDILSTDSYQIDFFESYRSKKDIINFQNFNDLLISFSNGDISDKLIFVLEDLMTEICTLINQKEELIYNYFQSGQYEYAIIEKKLTDRNLITIAKLEKLIEEENHIHEINNLKVFNECRIDYDLYKINYYDEYKFLMENFIQKFQKNSDRKNIFNEEFLEGILNIANEYNIFSTNKISILKKTFNLNKVTIEINSGKKIYAYLLIRRIKKYLKDNYKKIKYSDEKWENEFMRIIGMDEKEIEKYRKKGNYKQGDKLSIYWDTLEKYFSIK